MLNKNLKNLSDVPEWFDLKNYKTDNKDYLTPDARFAQIHKRMVLYQAIKSGFSKEVLRDELFFIRMNVFNDFGVEFGLRSSYKDRDVGFQLFDIEKTSYVVKSNIRPVSEITLGRLRRIYSDILESNVDFFDEKDGVRFNMNDFDCDKEDIKSMNLSDFFSEVSTRALVEIDLRASDAIIIRQLSEWLVFYRQKNNLMRDISKNGEYLFGRIKSYDLLAFIDLCVLWSNIEGFNVKPSLAAKIFNRSESEISKTIKPLAYSLLDPDNENFKQLCILKHNPSYYLTWDWD